MKSIKENEGQYQIFGFCPKIALCDRTGRSAEGYVTATLDPASSLGFPFQVAEG
jgi:hypothetical protein